MKKQKIIFIIAGVLILIAAFLRLYQIEGFMTFLGDQGRDAIIVKRILRFEHFPAIGAPSSVGQIYLGPFYYYLITPFLLFTNFNPVGLGIGVALLSIAGIVHAWYILQKKYGPVVSLPFLVFMVSSFVLIELSRFSWNPNLLPFFTFLTIYFFYKWVKEQNVMYALLFGAFTSFCIQLHYLSALSFIPITIVYLYFVFHLKKKIIFLKQSVFALTSFLFFNAPLILFDLRHNFLNTKNFIALFTEGKVSSDANYISKFLETNQAFFNHALQIEMEPMIAALAFFIVVTLGFLIIKKTKSILISLNILSFIIYILGFSVLASARHYHYYGPIYVSFYLLLACIPLLFKNALQKYVTAAILAAVFISFQIPHYYFLFNNPNNQIKYAREMASTFKPYIKDQPIQIVALPFTETDAHFRYFLELDGYKILDHDSPEQPAELFVMCFKANDCKPTDDPHWQIAAFQNKQLSGFWKAKNVTIYKIIHGK
jgi:4-amino-4-deoxy-L-arabinose transferase-like glycosyltransferase